MQVKIAMMADSHTYHNQVVVPECDILIHAGDFSFKGSQTESKDFLKWFNAQHQATEKVYIPGNHEYNWDYNKHLDRSKPIWLVELIEEYSNLHYLEHQSVTLFGLNIFGSPYTPEFFPEYWGFNRKRSEEIKAEWAKIPDNTDILVCHGAAKGFLDWTDERPQDWLYPGGHAGCEDLMNRIYQLDQLKLFVCGHLHNNTGLVDVPTRYGSIKYCNAAVVDNQYKVKHQPQVITLEV